MALQTTLRKTLKYGINLAAVLDSVFAMVNAEIIMVHFFINYVSRNKMPVFSAPPYKYTEYNAFTLTIILKHVSSGICSVITLEYVYLHLCSFYIVHFMTLYIV